MEKMNSWRSPSPTTRALLADVVEGLQVFRTRDGIQLTDDQILERARNIVAGLIGNYEWKSLDAEMAVA